MNALPTSLEWPHGISLHTLGGLANPLVHSIYPYARMYDLHASLHLPGLTGRWMDTGAFALGGRVAGPWHRLAHGHHLVEDGLKVLVTPQLKFGHFLHHLGLDALTRTGIPNPLIPSALGESLLRIGLPRTMVQEFLTLNVPKLLGGSLGLVLAGQDVVACFSGAIPATFGAAGRHFLFGCLNLAFGCWPPNFLLMGAAAAEFSVAGVTAWRALQIPIIESVGAPAGVFFPALGLAMGLGAAGGAAAALIQRRPDRIPALAFTGGAAAGLAKYLTAAAGSKGLPWILGPLAGAATALALRSLLLPVPRVGSLPFPEDPGQTGAFAAWERASPIGTFERGTLSVTARNLRESLLG